ncbi:MAG: T9SS type A sorting domain-containing protein [Saprospiraceae bacterium]
MNSTRHLAILWVMLTSFAPAFTQNACDHPNYPALVALYNATDGDNWTTSWHLSDCDVCSYFGITCDESGQIIEIDLDGNNLTGVIPPEIGEFSNLTGLNLAENALSGSIPSSIGQLTSLTGLVLTASQLTGSIPPEIGNLTELSSLWLNFNALSGEIPSSLGNLEKIFFLTLRGNNLSGNIPGSLGNLSVGEILLLNDNNLSGSLPKELSTFGNQREINPNARGGINVANNNLSGCYPIEFEAFCRTDFGLIVDGNENLSDFSEFCFFNNGLCDSTKTRCDNLQFIAENNQIIVSSLSIKSKLEIIGKNTDYNIITICDGDCTSSQTITDLASGEYTVKVNLFDANTYCYREDVITIAGNTTTEGAANCDGLSFKGESNQIVVEGLTANYNKVEIIGQNTDWQVILICDGDCPPTLSIPDLESGEYAVKVNQSGHDGSYCYREENVVVGNNANDNADCDKLIFTAENGQIIVEGLTASYDKVEIIGRNTDWQVVTICDGDCAETQIIPDLAAGEYSIKVNQGGSDGSYCYREQKVQLENGSNNRNRELDYGNDIVLYPNPARDRVYVQLPNVDFPKGAVHIYNVFGQQVSILAFDRFNQEGLAIDLDGFENGIYIITVQLDGLSSISRRVVVEHLK